MLNYTELMQLIETRLGKTENGQKITGPDVRAVVEALLDGLTQDGEKLPPYAAANDTLGKIPVLAESGFVDSSLEETEALGGKILSTSSAWLWGGNKFTKSFILVFAAGDSRHETTLLFPRGSFGMATVEVKAVGWGESRGALKLQYGIDTSNATADYVTVMQAEGTLPTELYITDTEYSTTDVGITIYQKAAASKQYLIEVSVVGSVAFLERLFERESLLSTMVVTARSSSPARAVTPPAITADAIPVQMSIAKDASGLKLAGDTATPNINQMYGTNSIGQKGWWDVPTPSKVLAKVYNGTIYSGTTLKQTLITLTTGGVTLADGNVLEATLVGELLQNSGAAANFIFELEIAHGGGTTTQQFVAESFVTNGTGYVAEWRVRLTKRGTGIYVLGSWQASRNGGGIFETGGTISNIASQLTINSIKINGTMAVNSGNMSMTPHVGWLTLI